MSTGTPSPAPVDLNQPTLACGASIDELLERIADDRADRRDDHQKRCAHCQAGLVEITELWAPVRQLSQQAVATPTGLAAAAMRHIDRLTHDVWYTLHLADGGAIRVATRVVATIARNAALRVPGVRVAFGRSSRASVAKAAETATRRHRHPQAAIGVLGRTAVIDLALTVSYRESIDEVSRCVQTQVIDELRRTMGLQHVVVNVTVDDVLPPPLTADTDRTPAPAG